MQRAEFFVILGHFCPDSDPPNNPKIQNFEKIKNRLEILSFYNCVPQMMINENPKNYNSEKKKKTPGDNTIIILQKCTINDNHMIYGS